MIPSIKNRIEEANAFQNGDGDVRVQIPPGELAELSEWRKREHTQRARANAAAILRSIEARAMADLMDVVPVDADRPFGLPGQTAYDHVWKLILGYVRDMNDIAALMDTCTFFRETLETKYTTLRLIEVAVKFANKLGGLNTLLSLRRVCKSGKAAVDLRFLQDTRDTIWFPENYYAAEWDDQWIPKPKLKMYVKDHWLRPLHSILSSIDEGRFIPSCTFPLRRIIVREVAGSEPLLTTLRTQLQRLLQVVGNNVTYFEYLSLLDSQGTYANLKRWTSLMPNLESLTVSLYDELAEPEDPPPVNVEAFTALPKFKRYAETEAGLRIPYLLAIIRSNPQISEVLLTEFPMVRTGQGREVAEGLATLQLERFHYGGMDRILPNPFLELRLHWPLKVLCLTLEVGGLREVSSRIFFGFVNVFRETLEELSVTWKVRDNGGFMDLPKVSKFLWKLWPGFTQFEFMVTLESLQYLDLDFAACPQINTSLESVKMFVNDSNLAALFPALRKVRGRREFEGKWDSIWIR